MRLVFASSRANRVYSGGSLKGRKNLILETLVKRALLSCLVLLGAPVAASADTATPIERWAPEAGDVIAFDVLRKGNPFGKHEVRFSETDTGALQVDVHVRLKAGLGPITLFRYELDSTELWQDGELVSLVGAVNDDGTREKMQAARVGDTLRVEGDALRGDVQGLVIPASHWNYRAMEQNQLLSSENGELIQVDIQPVGRETLEIDGQSIAANKYLLDSDIDVTLWYDDTGRWLKLAFEARGQSIEYVLRDLY